MDDWGAGDLQRRLANLIRVATISELDDSAARARVKCGAAPNSAWLPILTTRAGPDRSYWLPEPGEQVLVLSPSGDMTQGMILPALYQDAHAPPASTRNKHRTEYKDGTSIEYDRSAHKLTIDCAGDIDVTASGNVTATIGGQLTANVTGNSEITSPLITANGNVTINGDMQLNGSFTGSGGHSVTFNSPASFKNNTTFTATMTHNGKTIDSTHTHGGVKSGGSNTDVVN